MYLSRRLPCVRHTVHVRYLTHHAPQPTDDQIFRETKRTGTSLGTEEEWEAALKAQETGIYEERSPRPASDDVSMFATNRIGQVVLPAKVTQRVSTRLKDVNSQSLRHTVLRFHESLYLKNAGKKADVPMPASQDFSGMEADAYVAGFMPQLYTGVHTVLVELRKRLGKDWNPQTVLDSGMGPGTAAFAFHEVFVETNAKPLASLPQITIIEPNDEMRARATQLWDGFSDLPVKVYPSKGSTSHQHDVILAPHALDDCKGRPSERIDLVRDLWARLAPNGVLLLLERGNPAGFERIAAAREYILRKYSLNTDEAEAAHIIAPCPGDGQCPMYMQGHDPKRRSWCHFSQRLQRPDYLQRIRQSRTNTEDVNYSYIILRKAPRPSGPARAPASVEGVLGASGDSRLSSSETSQGSKGVMSSKDIVSSSYTWSRIILPPLKRHKHVVIDVCSAKGSGKRDMRLIQDTARSKTKTDIAASNQAIQPGYEQAQDQQGSQDDATEVDSEVQVKWSKRQGPILQRTTVPRSQGAAEYRFARRSHWGDLLPFRAKTVVNRPTTAADVKTTKSKGKLPRPEV